jgi:predicted metal-binding protein
MNRTEIIELANAEGFHDAEIIDTDKIVFDASFRPYCEENLCGQYGANYSCPPDCGTPDQMKQRVLAHKKALVVRTGWRIEDFSKADQIMEATAMHNAALRRLMETMKAAGHDGFMVSASGCRLCNPCKRLSGEPCAFPDRMYSCMSAYCIFVKKLAEDCHMNYDYSYADNILSFFGMYVFD